MRRPYLALLLVLLLAACDQDKKAEAPPPAPYDPQAVAHFCGMAVGEHPGPKGQIWVDAQSKPVWFTSVHDTIAFTLLPEEPKDIRAIYVNDMANAPNWQHADQGGWIEARKAFYVIGSTVSGGMGTPEEVPFSDKNRAVAFAQQQGGRVVTWEQIPKDDILGTPVGGDSNKPK
jgi:copper chaperone NosL